MSDGNRITASRQRNPGDSEGFTLLELLISLTLLGLIAAVLFGGLRFGLRAADTGNERLDRSRELLLAQSFLRRQLGQAMPLARGRDQGLETPWFDGGRDAIEFIAPMPAHLGLGGLYRVTLRTTGEPGSRRLTMVQRMFRPNDDDAPVATDGGITTLINGIERLRFAYYGAETLDERPQWRSEWTEMEALPALIRIQVTFPAGSGRHWPDLTVAPRIDGAAGCRYDAALKRCRLS